MDEAQDSSAYAELVMGGFDEKAVQAAAIRAREHLGGSATIAFVFCTCDYADAIKDLVELIQIHAHCPQVVGASASGLVGIGREEEVDPGFSLLILRLPKAEVCPVVLGTEEHASAWQTASRWNDDACTGWIVLGNPMLLGEDWLALWNAMAGRSVAYGGLASGSFRAEDLFLFNEHGIQNSAAIAIGFRGNVQVSGLVSQGCRPIGEPLTITRAEQNLIHQLASKSAYDQLQEAFYSLPETDREQAQGNILVGLAMSEYRDDFHTGDFLVRSILGGDPKLGILAVGATPRTGQTLQFQLRDHEAADAELRELLLLKRRELRRPPFAGLLFTCGGRGEQLFGLPHHDATLFREAFGAVPMSGMFCNGEIGTVGDRAYLHGFTASGVLLVEVASPEPRSGPDPDERHGQGHGHVGEDVA
jgi:small ligand-binding sensory domain FIST